MPKYGIIGILIAILAHTLTKYQYFSMKPSLFDKYILSNYIFSAIVSSISCITIKKPQKYRFFDSHFF